MNCGQVEALLEAYRSDSLGEPERTAVEGHLTGCASCRGMLAKDEALDGALESWAVSPPSPALAEELSRKIEVARQRSPHQVRMPLALAVGLFLLLAASLIGNILLLRNGAEMPPDVPVYAGAPALSPGPFATSEASLVPVDLPPGPGADDREPIFW